MTENAYKKTEVNEEVDYEKLVNTPEFKNLMKQKRKFIFPMSIFFLTFYFMLPILAGYSDVLRTNAIGPITWSWFYALLNFISVWVVGYIYAKKSATFDKKIEGIFKKYKGELKL